MLLLRIVFLPTMNLHSSSGSPTFSRPPPPPAATGAEGLAAASPTMFLCFSCLSAPTSAPSGATLGWQEPLPRCSFCFSLPFSVIQQKGILRQEKREAFPQAFLHPQPPDTGHTVLAKRPRVISNLVATPFCTQTRNLQEGTPAP